MADRGERLSGARRRLLRVERSGPVLERPGRRGMAFHEERRSEARRRRLWFERCGLELEQPGRKGVEDGEWRWRGAMPRDTWNHAVRAMDWPSLKLIPGVTMGVNLRDGT